MRVRTEEKRTAILAVAAQVFGEMGFEAASMAEITARVGGSKATLYGYFPSKEALFIEVSQSAAQEHLAPAFMELENLGEDIEACLQRFGEKFLAFICAAHAMPAMRMVIAESGKSDIGRRFYESGPGRGEQRIAVFLDKAMSAGQLRRADTLVATRHLLGLLNAELLFPLLFGLQASLTRRQMRPYVERAVSAFLMIYRS